jgi:MFS family permease
VLAFSNSLFAPAASGLVSVYAGPAEQGTVLGAAQAIAALGRSLGPLALGVAYDRWGGTTAFLTAGTVMGLAALSGFALEHVSPAATAPPVVAAAGDSGHAGIP